VVGLTRGSVVSSTDLASSETHMRFSYKNPFEHLASMLGQRKSLLALLGWAVAVFGVLMTGVGAASYFLNASLRGWAAFVIVIVLAVALALAKSVHSYVNRCPAGLENESAESQRIAQIQRPKWEFRLARRLLEERLRDLDVELEDLLGGRVFVPVERQLDPQDYIAWVQTRPANALRLVDVAKRLLVFDFPAALLSNEGRPADPVRIVDVVDLVQGLYSETVQFERASRTVEPPETLGALHDFQMGWTDPIREGVRQIFQFLDGVLAVDPKTNQEIHFTITFEESANIQKFNEELDRLISEEPWAW